MDKEFKSIIDISRQSLGLFLWSPFFICISYYGDQHHLELQAQPFPKTYYLVAFALLSALISQILNWICYEKLLGFQKLNNLRILSRFLLENNLYLVKKVKREKRMIEKIRLPQVYLKQSLYGLEVSFILEGNKFQDRFLNLGATLEVMFNGDFRNKTFDKRFY